MSWSFCWVQLQPFEAPNPTLAAWPCCKAGKKGLARVDVVCPPMIYSGCEGHDTEIEDPLISIDYRWRTCKHLRLPTTVFNYPKVAGIYIYIYIHTYIYISYFLKLTVYWSSHSLPIAISYILIWACQCVLHMFPQRYWHGQKHVRMFWCIFQLITLTTKDQTYSNLHHLLKNPSVFHMFFPSKSSVGFCLNQKVVSCWVAGPWFLDSSGVFPHLQGTATLKNIVYHSLHPKVTIMSYNTYIYI